MNNRDPVWTSVQCLLAIAAASVYVILLLSTFSHFYIQLLLAGLLPPTVYVLAIRSPLVIVSVGLLMLIMNIGSFWAFWSNRHDSMAAGVVGLYPFYATFIVLCGTAFDRWYVQRND